MLKFFNFTDLFYFAILFGFAYLGYWILDQARTRDDLLKKILYIPSGKSASGAILLGGLVFSIISILGISLLPILKSSQFLFHSNSLAFFIAAFFLTILGYYDDKFEIRARYKLLGHFVILAFFSMLSIKLNHPVYSPILQILYAFFSIVILNGTNLLDGIDALTFKISMVTYGSFMILAYIFDSPDVFYLSVIFMMPSLAFYFFNKYPSRIHLGEIGSTVFGLSYIFLASTLFMHLEHLLRFTVLTNILIVSTPLHLFILEVVVSFFRRIINRTPPFVGDKLHFHYLLRDAYGLSVTKTTTVYAGLCLAVNLITIGFYAILNFVWIGTIGSIVIYMTVFFIFGKKYWFSNLKEKLFFAPKDAQDDITIINNELLQGIEFEVTESN